MTFHLTLEAPTQTEIDTKMIDHLRGAGYHVAPPHEEWETPRAFCDRVGLNIRHVRRFFDHPRTPKIPTHRGPTGRILELLSNPAFDAFCRRNKK